MCSQWTVTRRIPTSKRSPRSRSTRPATRGSRPRGILVVNLWGGDKIFQTLLKRIEGAFPGGTLCLPAERPGNVIVFAFKDAREAFRWSDLTRTAVELEALYGLEFPKFVAGLRKMNRYDEEHLYV